MRSEARRETKEARGRLGGGRYGEGGMRRQVSWRFDACAAAPSATASSGGTLAMSGATPVSSRSIVTTAGVLLAAPTSSTRSIRLPRVDGRAVRPFRLLRRADLDVVCGLSAVWSCTEQAAAARMRGAFILSSSPLHAACSSSRLRVQVQTKHESSASETAPSPSGGEVGGASAGRCLPPVRVLLPARG